MMGSEQISFSVTDTGIGIDRKLHHLLFQNFSQLDRSIHQRFGGTGLGLAISKRLVEAMDGEIAVDSDLGQGSTFRVLLPYRAAETPLAMLAKNSGPRISSARILVAEDIHINRLVVEAALVAAGHEVVMVENGVQAVNAVLSSRFDLVLMDLEMPEMGGLQAARAIREIDHVASTVPIVALTANAMDEQIANCLAAGMNGHVAKPIDRELPVGRHRSVGGHGGSRRTYGGGWLALKP